MSDDQLYREHILDHYKHPHHYGQLPHPHISAHDLNPTCGDELTFQLTFDQAGAISGVAFDGHGCAISQAAASMLTDEIQGKTTAELLTLDCQTVLQLLGIEISATRIKCATLALKVLKTAALKREQALEREQQQHEPACTENTYRAQSLAATHQPVGTDAVIIDHDMIKLEVK